MTASQRIDAPPGRLHRGRGPGRGRRAPANLVLSGGGINCVAFLGALAELEPHWRWERVAGTSGGAIVAAFIAAGRRPRRC